MGGTEALDTLLLAAERGMDILALLPVSQFRTPVAESFRNYCDFVTSQCDDLAIAERFRSELVKPNRRSSVDLNGVSDTLAAVICCRMPAVYDGL